MTIPISQKCKLRILSSTKTLPKLSPSGRKKARVHAKAHLAPKCFLAITKLYNQFEMQS